MNIIFDIGNVLLRWEPERAVAHIFPDPQAAHAYFARVGFYDWNLEQDAGRSFADGLRALEAAHPDVAAPLASYVAHFALTIQNRIEGTWSLLERLRAKGHLIFGLTNFASETWDVAVQLHPDLKTAFDDVVVSGQEGCVKPDPKIYRTLLARNGLTPQTCYFIDDSAANVDGARALGIAAHRFTTPEALEEALAAQGLL